MRSAGLKRVLDGLGASALLLLALPVMAVLALLVASRLGSPVFFRQERSGLGGRAFPLLKFRTMTNERDETGRLLPDERRLTPLGRWLRRTTLDELPELLNVLRGDMSLVGPRPLLTKYLPLYSPHQRRRLEAKPGLTGWAVVHGRNALTWEERFDLDVWYVDHWTNGLDLRILLRTVGLVLRRSGVNAEGHSTMPEFRGGDRA